MNTSELGFFLVTFIDLYIYLIIARCLLSFFPAINWSSQPWLAIRGATDPAMAPFRNLIPPIGGLDLSPILLFFLLNILKMLVAGALIRPTAAVY